MTAIAAAETHRMPMSDLFAAAAINVMWGLNVIAVKMGVMATAPFTAALLRHAVVFLVCVPFLRIVHGRMGAVLLLGLIAGAAQFIVLNLAMAVSDNVPALAIASQLGIPFALLLAVMFLGERIAVPRMLGIGFTFAGIVLLVFDPAAGREVPGLLLTALSALCWAVGSMIQRRITGVPVLTVYAWIGLVGSAVIAPIALLLEPATIAGLPWVDPADLGWILFSGVGATVLGHGGVAWLLQRHPITAVVPLMLAAPAVAVLASSFYFGTALTPLMIAGGVIVMAGVAIINVRGAAKSVPATMSGDGGPAT